MKKRWVSFSNVKFAALQQSLFRLTNIYIQQLTGGGDWMNPGASRHSSGAASAQPGWNLNKPCSNFWNHLNPKSKELYNPLVMTS